MRRDERLQQMGVPVIVQEPLQQHERLCHQQGAQMLWWLALVAACGLLVVYVNAELIAVREVSVELLSLAAIPALILLLITGMKVWNFYCSKSLLTAFQLVSRRLEPACQESSSERIKRARSEAALAAKGNHLVAKLLQHYEPILSARLISLHKDRLRKSLKKEVALLQRSCESKVAVLAREVPLIKVKDKVESSLSLLTRRRQEKRRQWKVAYEDFSWWNKLKYSDGPDFSGIDSAIYELTKLQMKLGSKHSADFEKLDLHFEHIKQRAISRMLAAKADAERFIQDGTYREEYDGSILTRALWLSAMSVPVSLWFDVDRASNVYDALRGVNGNFAGMSDSEIWWETLFMPAENLAGLVALTKGAYFEQLVVADTGGQLFEHFNHADTDIVIDGIAFQLKATDSVAYVASVDDDIPVIATSEVAFTTGAIDSGYGNEELTSVIDNALGGTIVDVGDTAGDAILVGLGGLGFFATIAGINHASAKYENGGDAVEAIFEGAGVAIEGTARSIVNAAEMGYKMLASRPSRFVGRCLLWVGKKLIDVIDGKDTSLKARGPSGKKSK